MPFGEESSEMKSQNQKILSLAFVVMGIGMIVMMGIALFDYQAVGLPRYRRAIGDWAKNAEDSPTFEQSIHFLHLFNDSMNKEGLAPDGYNSAWGWDQTPQNQMYFQYSYVGQMIVRAQYYINLTQAAKPNSGVFQDVYNQALTNFRSEMSHNGPLDWVALNAWTIKNGYYWEPLQGFGWFMGGVFGGIMVGAGIWPEDSDNS